MTGAPTPAAQPNSMNALPPCGPHDHRATAIYLDLIPNGGGRCCIRKEAVKVSGRTWQVHRDGRLVPLASVQPQPAALRMQDGSVQSDGRWYPSVEEFARQNGIAA